MKYSSPLAFGVLGASNSEPGRDYWLQLRSEIRVVLGSPTSTCPRQRCEQQQAGAPGSPLPGDMVPLVHWGHSRIGGGDSWVLSPHSGKRAYPDCQPLSALGLEHSQTGAGEAAEPEPSQDGLSPRYPARVSTVPCSTS